MLASELHSKKAPLPIDVTLSGIVLFIILTPKLASQLRLYYIFVSYFFDKKGVFGKR